jgi:hypothetical protein
LMPKAVIHSESSLQALIGKRYAPPAFATLLHVRNQTGFRRTVRTADALVMSLYPSRGLELMGFEIKCSRTDWKKELDDPSKAEEFCQFCDRWWVVTAEESVIQPGELPPTWGHLLPRGDALRCKVEAPKLPAPKEIPRPFLAGILRNVTETYVSRSSIFDKVEEANRTGYQRGLEHGKSEAGCAPARLKELSERIRRFEEESGIAIDRWEGGRIGKVARAISELTDGWGSLQHVAAEAEQIAKRAREAQAEFLAAMGMKNAE